MLEAQSNRSRLVEAIKQRTEREIVIARNGRPAARLVAMHLAPCTSRIWITEGLFEMPDDLDTSNPEIDRLFLGKEEP